MALPVPEASGQGRTADKAGRARVRGCSPGVHDRGERCASDYVATVLALTPVLFAFQIFDEETLNAVLDDGDIGLVAKFVLLSL